jgi:hypothetical protein
MAQHQECCGIKAQKEPPIKLTEWHPMISFLVKIVAPKQSERSGHFDIPLGVHLPEVLEHKTGTKRKKNRES